MASDGERYTELMAPALMEGLSEIRGVLEADASPIVNIYSVQNLIKPKLQEIDWEATELPRKSFGLPDEEIGERNLSPREYAQKLLVIAIDDAYSAIRPCEAYAEKHDLPAGTSLRGMLMNSKHHLLLISRLMDEDKSRLINALHQPGFTQLFIGSPLDTYDPIQVNQDTKGRHHFEWKPSIQMWIKNNTDPEVGCPANHEVVTDSKRKNTTLVYYFWDKLIEASFGIDDPSD